jgi:hypothetical protein
MPEPVPRRIQLSRAKGWRLPEGSINVSRPSRWGNPWRAVQIARGWQCVSPMGLAIQARDEADARDLAVLHYRAWIAARPGLLPPLHGRNLACWCPLDGLSCHADVLLELANPPLRCEAEPNA